MTIVPILLGAALLVLALAFGLHCFVLQCDQRRPAKLPADGDSPFQRA